MTDAQMAADHEKDYREKAQLDSLRMRIEEFLKDPPAGLWPATASVLEAASRVLGQQSAHVSQVWD